MIRRSRWIPLLALSVILTLIGAASSRAAVITTLDDGLTPDAAAPEQVAAACTVEPGAIGSISFIWTPPEELKTFYWRIPVAGCAACAASGAITPTALTLRMRWLKACSAQVQVKLVGTQSVAGCVMPDTTQLLCGPQSYTITGISNAVRFHTLTLPGGCCISGPAFVYLRFTGLGACASGATSPGLAASVVAPVACDQFVTATGVFPTLTDWSTIGATTSTWLSLDSNCCVSTPARAKSWGSVKTIYR